MSFDPEQIAQKLQGYPTEIVDAFSTFVRDGDFEAFEAGFLGALGFLAEASDPATVRNAPGEARLHEDLNIDSLAMVELVFLLEDAFGTAIRDEELQRVRTVNDIRQLARGRFAARAV
jgi:acyl carrier protein